MGSPTSRHSLKQNQEGTHIFFFFGQERNVTEKQNASVSLKEIRRHGQLVQILLPGREIHKAALL